MPAPKPVSASLHEVDEVRVLVQNLLDAIPGIIRQAVKEEFDFQKSKLQPLSHAARLIGISPTTAHNYKRAGLLAGRVDVFGKIIPRELLAIHLDQRKED